MADKPKPAEPRDPANLDVPRLVSSFKAQALGTSATKPKQS